MPARRAFAPLLARLLPAIAVALAAGTAAAADPDALWKIVHDRCVPNELERQDPQPCAAVALQEGAERGYVFLKDIEGVAQYLLIPTARVTGIESPVLLAPEGPNYFAAAWRGRGFVEAALHGRLPRDAVSLTINSSFGRSQNQLHIHIDCTAAAVRDAVLRNAEAIGPSWAPFPEPLAGHPYRAMRLVAAELDGVDPFKLLAASLSDPGAMGQHTLAVLGVEFAGGQPGFVLLDDRVDAATGDRAHAEELQDHDCRVAPAG